jgi:radical SAM protein (TIGR01212 family)
VNPSTISTPDGHPFFDWRGAGLNYYTYGFYLKNRFQARVQKVTLDGGFTCPNVDGTVAVGGCTFCDNRSFSPVRRTKRVPILEQLEQGIVGLRHYYAKVDKFLAYFQPATNTYAPLEKLKRTFEPVMEDPRIVGLVIGTRPDCVPNEVLDYLQELSHRTYLSLEYGMQTIHNASLDWMNRGHHHDAFVDAMTRSQGRGMELCAHVILGLPGETDEQMMETAEELARWKIDAVKIHNLYAVPGTRLADQVESGEVTLMGRDHFVRVLVDFLERLPPHTIVERITGDAPANYFVGPAWCLDKAAVRTAVDKEFADRKTFQGRLYKAPQS